MFTRINHPVTGGEIQIKTGYDDCSTYNVGDVLENWSRSSEPVTGCYVGWYDRGDSVLVIIRGGRIEKVLDLPDFAGPYAEEFCSIVGWAHGVEDFPEVVSIELDSLHQE